MWQNSLTEIATVANLLRYIGACLNMNELKTDRGKVC